MTWRQWLDNAADAVCSEVEGNRRNALNVAAFKIGGTLHWHDADEGEAWDVLSAAARSTGLDVATVNATIRDGFSDGAKRPLADKRGESARWSIRSPRRPFSGRTAPPTTRPKPTGRSRSGVRLWHAAQPVDVGTPSAVAAYLAARGLNARRLADHGIARLTDDATRPLVVPLYDPRGELAGVMRRMVRPPAEGEIKSLTSHGTTGARVIACEKGRRMLAGDATAAEHGVLVLEGETDALTWATLLDPRTSPAILAIPGSGSWSRDLADRIPHGSRVAVLTDRDAAGRKYRDRVAADLADRCEAWCRPDLPLHCERYPDESDMHRAGELGRDPWSGLVPLHRIEDGVSLPVAPLRTLADGRRELASIIAGIVQGIEPGRRHRDATLKSECAEHVIVAATGTGKTHAAGLAVLRLWQAGSWCRWSRREHAALHDTREDLLRVADAEVAAGRLTPRDRDGFAACIVKVPSLRDGCTRPWRLDRFLDATGRQSAACDGCPMATTCEARRAASAYRELKEHRRVASQGVVLGYDEAGDDLRATFSEAAYGHLMRRSWVRMTTHDRETVAGPQGEATDLHVVDEAPSEAVRPVLEVTIHDLATARELGALECDDNAWDRLAGLLTSARHTVDPERLAAAFDGVTVGDVDQLRAAMVERARAEADHGRAYDRTDPDQRIASADTIAALTGAHADGWTGADAGEGALRFRAHRPMDRKITQARIYLDATACPVVYDRICPGATWHVVNASPPVPTVARHLTSRDRWAPHPDNVSGELTRERLRIWNADDGATLYVMPRKLMVALDELADDAPAGYLAARRADRVTYYGSAAMRGTNQWGHLSRVVIVAHHVPGSAVDAEARFLGCRDAAHRALNVAPVVQAVGRVARVAGVEARRVEIIGAAPCTYGLNAERESVDVAAMRHGAAPRGIECLAAMVKDRIGAAEPAPFYRLSQVLAGAVSGSTLVPLYDTGAVEYCPGQARKLMDNNGLRVADVWDGAGIGSVPVKWTTAKNTTRVVLGMTADTLDADELERWLRSLPEDERPRRVEWKCPDTGATVGVELWDVVLGPALRRLARSDKPPTVRGIAGELARVEGGPSQAAVGRMVKGRGAEVRALWERYKAEHAASVVPLEAPNAAEVEAFDERAAIMEADAGLPRPVAERRAAGVVTGSPADVHRLERAAGPAPPPRRAWVPPICARIAAPVATMMLAAG